VGLFVAFEGGEGSGKSTQAASLCARLLECGVETVLVHEPGGTPLGCQIRDILKAHRLRPLTPEAEFFLFEAARAQLTTEIILPALQEGKVVVCDRFSYSTLAYQGCGRGMDSKTLQLVNAVATRKLEADLVVLLDVPPREGLARKGAREDPFEQEDIAFHERVRQGYLKAAHADRDRWLVLDATQKPDQIATLVWEKIGQLLHGVPQAYLNERSG
jgi:dTMP kinase